MCRNFALVEDQRVTLAPGLNVLTGESGAGKSVLVEALSQALGAQTPDGCIRPPAETVRNLRLYGCRFNS